MWIFFQLILTVVQDSLLVESADVEPGLSRADGKVMCRFSIVQRDSVAQGSIMHSLTYLQG